LSVLRPVRRAGIRSSMILLPSLDLLRVISRRAILTCGRIL
jgi:hypothetical protein